MFLMGCAIGLTLLCIVDIVTTGVNSNADNAARFIDVIDTLADENAILIEREAGMVRLVVATEEESRALKTALSESVAKMQAQEERINEVIDSNSIYMLQIRTLRTLLKRTEKELEKTKEDLEKALAVPSPC